MANLASVISTPRSASLSDAEMQTIESVEQDCQRLEASQDWRDLWDLGGTIAT